MIGLFFGCHSLISLPNISRWDTDNVFDFTDIFCDCKNLKFLPDLSRWNLERSENLFNIFGNCNSLNNIQDIYAFLEQKIFPFNEYISSFSPRIKEINSNENSTSKLISETALISIDFPKNVNKEKENENKENYLNLYERNDESNNNSFIINLNDFCDDQTNLDITNYFYNE